MSSLYKDPVTGDDLTRLEYWVRQVQVAVRTPWFILVFNLITLACILLHRLMEWNDLASWLAIIVEWLVGTYMFGQTGRDALILREVRAGNRRIEDLATHILTEEVVIEERLEEKEPA